MREPLTRRTFLVGSLATGGLLLVACGGDDDAAATTGGAASTDTPTPDVGWTFVDDRGATISTAARPSTLVVFSTQTAALAELGIVPAGVFAWSALADDTQLRYADLTGVTTVGEVWGELNIETLATLDPDVVITGWDATDGTLSGITDEQRPHIEAVAPLLAMDNTAPLTEQFDRLQELATALGADLSSAEVLDLREQFNALSHEVEQAAAERPGLRIMAVSASQTGMNVAQPQPNPDLTYYGTLGLQFVEPDGEGTFWWQELSPELIATYPADVILVDTRSGDADLDALAQLPLWSTLPAVQAGQVFGWHAYDPPTYRFYVDALTDLRDAIARSQVVT